MPRRRPAFKKTKRLFVIATEGARTEPLYFQEFRPGRDGSYTLKILETRHGKSKPSDVLSRLINYQKQNRPMPNTEYWAVIDRDSWTEQDLNEVTSEIAKRENYHLALSNPCFELWLWLHLRSNRTFADRHDLQRQLVREWPEYAKGRYEASLLMPNVPMAVERAKELDVNANQPWPQQQATRVYHLVRQLH